MDQDTRDRIRHLYFVERAPVRAIAEALALSAQAVRGALVLPGGQADRRDPAPMASALVVVRASTERPSRPGASIRRRVTGRHS